MSDASWRTVRTVFLAAVITCSVVVGGIGFAESVGAAAGASEQTAATDIGQPPTSTTAPHSIADPETATTINSCRVIDSPGTYYLTSDLETDLTCIEITASDVAFDGGGHDIVHSPLTDATSEVAIAVGPGVSNVTVGNATIRYFGTAVEFDGVDDGNVSDIDAVRGFETNRPAYAIRDDGIVLEGGSDNNTVEDNSLNDIGTDPDDAGILVSDATDNRIVGNSIFAAEGSGIALDEADQNNVSDNDVTASFSGRTGFGIEVRSGSTRNLVEENRLNGGSTPRTRKGLNGIEINAPDNRVRDNIIRNWYSDGIRVSENNTTVVGNTLRSNYDQGIGVFDVSEANVTENLVTGSGAVDDTGADGIYVEASEVTLRRNEVSRNNGDGYHLVGVTSATIRNNSANSNDDHAIRLESTAELTVAGFEFGTLAASRDAEFTGRNIALTDYGEELPEDPSAADRLATGHFNVTTTPGGYADLTLGYTEPALSRLDLNESTLEIWRYDPPWNAVSGSSVDTARNEVTGNLSGSGLYAISGLDTNPPEVTTFSAGVSDGNLTTRVNVTEQLSTVEVRVTRGGSTLRTLTAAEFTETEIGRSGNYTYRNTTALPGGQYNVTLETAEDAAGNDGAAGQRQSVTSNPLSIASASAADATDGNGNVTTDDSITVRADVDGVVGAVTANASAFGGSESLPLSDGDGDGTYNATFTVTATGGDGDYPVNVTATNTEKTVSAETGAIRLDTDGPVFRFDTGDGVVDLEDGNGEVDDGDRVGVNVTAFTASGLANLQVSASDFGVETVALAEVREGEYTGTFVVDAANASDDGTYSLTGSATNGVGLTTSDTSASLTLDTTEEPSDETDPVFTDVRITDVGNPPDFAVDVGDEIRVNTTVSDSGGSGVASVELDASGFGRSDPVILYDNDTDGTYNATFTVGTETALSDGRIFPDITATDGAGNDNTTRPTTGIILDTTPPEADIVANRTTVEPGGVVEFNISGSTDPGSTPSGLADYRITSNGNFVGSGLFRPGTTATNRYINTGTFTVEVTVSDFAGNADTDTVTVTVEDAPTANNDEYTTSENSTLSVTASGVLENDVDPDDDTLNATLLAGPTNGSLTLDADGSFTYTPNTSFTGTDSFTYNATDGSLNDTATVTITVTPVNDAPTARNDSYTVSESTDRDLSTLDISAPGVLGNDSDPDGDSLSASVVRRPTNGTLTLAANGSLSYTPDQRYTGTDSFTYEATDGSLNDTATVTITVTETNQAPIARDDSYATNENETLNVSAPGVLDDDTDPDSDDLSASVVNRPDNGTLTLNDNGSFSYIPVPGFNGSNSFTYEASDGSLTDTATVTITVESQDQPPAPPEPAPAPPEPVVTAPDDDIYVPSRNGTPEIGFNATGAIAPADIGIEIRNATAGNGTVVANATPGVAAGTTELLIPGGTLSGNVTLNVTLVNTTTGTVSASDRVNLTAATPPSIFAPADGTYDPTTETTIGTFHVADGVIAPTDVAVRLRNVTGSNDTVVARNTSVPLTGRVNTTVPAGQLSGNVTLRIELYNDSTGATNATALLSLTAATDGDGPNAGVDEPAPVVLVLEDGTYDPTREFNVGVDYNATGFVTPADVALRFRNATAGNDTVVATARPGNASGDAEVTIPAGALSGNVTLNVTLTNGSTDAVYAAEQVNYTADTTGGGDAPPVSGGPAAPTIVAPANATYQPGTEFNLPVSHNASGVIAPADVGVRLRNVTDGNGTIVTSNTSVPVDGESVLTVPAGALNGSVTLRAELYNTSDTTKATTTVNLTVESTADDGPTVVTSSVSHVGGERPDMSNVSLRAEFSSGLLQLQFLNASNDQAAGDKPSDQYELDGLGADDTTRLRVTVTVANFTPRVLIGSANEVNWTRTRTADGNWTISITGSPAEVHSYFEGGTGPDNWNGSLVATQSQNQTITYAVDGLSTVPAQYRERLNGSVFITDAQEFGVPQYNATATPDRVELTVAAPHFETDGQTVNEGFFEAKLPSSLLDEWGVTAADLVGRFNGTQRTATVSATPDGGARISFDVTYSEGTAAVTYNESGPTAPSIVAPPNRTYDPTQPLTLSTSHDAAGAIDSTDVAVRLVNLTDGNDEEVALNDSVPVAGEVNTTIPAGALSGNVTIETQLYNNSSSSKQVVATDTVTLTVETPADDDDGDNGGDGGGSTPPSDGGGDGVATFGETQQVTDSDLPRDLIRAERTVADNISVGLLRSSEFNYSIAITGPDNETNVTFYLQTTAISNSQDIENLTMYLNGQPRNFTVNESAGPGSSPWVRFTIPHFSTQVISFTSGVELSNPSVSKNTIQSGESVTVNATLENTGNESATVTLNLTDNGTQISNQTVEVADGETKQVSFTPTLNETRVHELGISGLSAGNVTVEEESDTIGDETETETETSSQAPGFGPVVTLAALLSAAVLALRRRGS